MAYFKITSFAGMAPSTSPRLLANDVGQMVKDILLESSRLVPITDHSAETSNLGGGGSTLATSDRTTIYKYEYDASYKWLEWTEDVDVAPGPVAGNTQDRLYWTGEGGNSGFPRMSIDTAIINTGGSGKYPRTSYRLGIPAPTSGETPSSIITASSVQGNAITFNGSSASIVSVDNDTITVTADQYTALANGDAVIYGKGSGGTVITGLTDDTTYYVIRGDSPIIKLATTFTNAIAGSAINLTGLGAGTAHILTPLDDGTQTKYSTSYVYTFVSEYGEEGPRSLASAVFDKVDGQTVQVTLPATSLSGTGRTNTNITHKRLYRSNTGSNTTAFQYVAEMTLGTTTYNDSLDNDELAEVIPSTYWIGPPNEDTSLYPEGPMLGLTAMPGGIFAGFRGKRLYFSDAYMPHAWPVSYRITIEEEIVAIGMAGNGLIVTTRGTPYLVSGSDPRAMQVLRIEAAQACLNKASLVDMGDMVMYAGADGLVAAAGTDVQVITYGIINPQQWRTDYYPTALKGFRWEGKYIGLYTSGSNYGGFIFDPRGGKKTLALLTQTSTTDAAGGFTDPDDNELYIIIDNAIKKFQGGSTFQTYTWKSKMFVPPKPTSMGFLKVDAEAWPVTVKVYGDGALFYQATISTSGNAYAVTGSTPSFSATDIPEPIVRLPAKVYKTFEIQLEAAKVVNEVCIAESIDELRGV